MKVFVTVLAAMFACAAFAITLAQPRTIIKDEMGHDVWCGEPFRASQVEGPYADGAFSGLLYQRSQCPTGGRGTKPRYFSACAAVAWRVDGSIESIDVLWTSNPQKAGVLPRPSSDCIN